MVPSPKFTPHDAEHPSAEHRSAELQSAGAASRGSGRTARRAAIVFVIIVFAYPVTYGLLRLTRVLVRQQVLIDSLGENQRMQLTSHVDIGCGFYRARPGLLHRSLHAAYLPMIEMELRTRGYRSAEIEPCDE